MRNLIRVPAIEELEAWLDAHERSRQWLVDEINRLRAEAGVKTRIGRATIWRWENVTKMNVDDAVLIERATSGGVPVALWSRYEVRARRLQPKRVPKRARNKSRAAA